MEPVHPAGAPLGGQLDLAPSPVTPLVFQVLPLPGLSDQEEFSYNCLPDVLNGTFAPARTFFIEHNHKVAVHDCLIVKCVPANLEHIPTGLEAFPAINSSDFMNWKTFLPFVFFGPPK